ncbi:MAG: hypothetical protein M9932_18125 [Xanthobacteraceae bacterium]|nr:hypothetical protein [Xanthobacteraceae bacterium]
MALTIIEAAAETKLTTIAAAKAEMQLTSGADDAYLTTLIDQASDAVRSWCKRVFAIETVRESIYPDTPGKSLMLSRWPVVAIAAVTINGVVEDVANVEAEDSGHLFRLDASGCRASWPSGRIVVEYSGGYVLPGQPNRTLPNDIERAALSLVRGSWFARTRDPLIRSEAVDGIGSTDYFSGTVSRLPPDAESLLSPYRNVKLG